MKPPERRYRPPMFGMRTEPSEPLDTIITRADVFWSTLQHYAALHSVSPDQLAYTLRTVHAHEEATAAVLFDCAARLAHAGYVVPPPVPPPQDPAVLRELAEANAESRRRSAARARAHRGRFAA